VQQTSLICYHARQDMSNKRNNRATKKPGSMLTANPPVLLDLKLFYNKVNKEKGKIFK